MSFKSWFNEDDHDLYNFPDEAMEAAWNAGRDDGLIAEQQKSLKLCREVVKLRKEIRDGKQVREEFDEQSG